MPTGELRDLFFGRSLDIIVSAIQSERNKEQETAF